MHAIWAYIAFFKPQTQARIALEYGAKAFTALEGQCKELLSVYKQNKGHAVGLSRQLEDLRYELDQVCEGSSAMRVKGEGRRAMRVNTDFEIPDLNLNPLFMQWMVGGWGGRLGADVLVESLLQCSQLAGEGRWLRGGRPQIRCGPQL